MYFILKNKWLKLIKLKYLAMNFTKKSLIEMIIQIFSCLTYLELGFENYNHENFK